MQQSPFYLNIHCATHIEETLYKELTDFFVLLDSSGKIRILQKCRFDNHRESATYVYFLRTVYTTYQPSTPMLQPVSSRTWDRLIRPRRWYILIYRYLEVHEADQLSDQNRQGNRTRHNKVNVFPLPLTRH